MSHIYKCKRCGDTAELARAKRCSRSPCPMEIRSTEIDPRLVVDSKGMTRVTLPKGSIVYLRSIPMRLWVDAEFEIHVSNLEAAGLL